jgi:hypothetical protein
MGVLTVNPGRGTLLSHGLHHDRYIIGPLDRAETFFSLYFAGLA